MLRNSISLTVLALLAMMTSDVPGQNATPNPIETKLRDALRTTMIQLRDTQGQIATLQEAQTESDKQKADMRAKIDTLNDQIKTLAAQAAADKIASEKAISDLKQSQSDLVTRMVDTLSTQINSLNKPAPDNKAVLDKAIAAMKTPTPDLTRQLDQYGTDIQLWTTGYNQYVDLANRTEAERGKLAAQAILLQRLVTDRETKNLELYKTGGEILDRYEKYSLGDALTAKEPFVGLTRAKLQEFVQDYKDKLSAQKIAIGQPPATAVQVANTPEKNQIR